MESSKVKKSQQTVSLDKDGGFFFDSLVRLSNSSDLASLQKAILLELKIVCKARSAILYLISSDQKSLSLVDRTGLNTKTAFIKTCAISKTLISCFKKLSLDSTIANNPNKTISALINKVRPADDQSIILPIPLTDDIDLMGLVFCVLSPKNNIADVNFKNIEAISRLSSLLLTNVRYCRELMQTDLLGWKIPCSKMYTSQQIKSLIDSFEECFFVLNPADGKIIDANQRAGDFLKYKKSELINRSFLKFHPQEYQKTAQETFDIALRDGGAKYQIPLIAKTGVVIPVQSRIQKGFWLGKEALFCISKDLSAVKISEEKLRLIIDHVDQNVWMVDCNYNIIEFNESFAREFEKAYQIKLVVGINIVNELYKILPDLANEWQSRYDRALNGESFTKLDKFIVQDKELFIESDFFPILSEKQVTGVSVFSKDVTQRKISELLLKASEEKYKMAFNYVAFGMVLTAPDSKLIDVNPYFCDMVGYSRDDLLAMKIDDIIYSEDRATHHRRAQELFTGKIPFLWLEIRFVHKRGFVQWGMISSTILRDKAGNSKFSISHIQDITEKRNAEKELRKKTEQQASILKTARHLTQSLEIKDVLEKIAIGAREMLDSPSISIYFLSDDQQTLYPVIALEPEYKKEIMATPLQVKDSYTGKAIVKRGGVIFNSLSGSVGQHIPGTPEDVDERLISTPFILENEILGALTINRFGKNFTEDDLSLAETYATYAATALKNARIYEALQREIKDRKRAEYGLNELNLEYEKFIQNNLVGIWKLTLSPPISVHYSVKNMTKKIYLNAVVANCNDAAAKMYNLSSKDVIINQPLNKLNINNRNWVNVIDKFIKNNYQMEMADMDEIVNDEKRHFRYSFFGNVEDGRLSWIWGIQLDVTGQKHLEEQLLQSQKMESIGTLAGGIAHDFNNLLTVINGHAELAIMKTSHESPIYKDLNLILEGGERAGNLTRQLLAFSRKQIIKPKVLDINKLIANMDKMLRRLLSEDIAIEKEFDPGVSKIEADPGQVEQILMNLVINARDAINDVKPRRNNRTIWISTKSIAAEEIDFSIDHESTSDKYVIISVRDNGAGMKDEVKEKIFDPFFTTKPVGKGTGLGLATTYGIIRQNKGFIKMESRYKHGSSFAIYWPAITKSKSASLIKEKGDVNIKGNEKILVVEDDDAVREFATTVLKELGYQVVEQPDGKAALNYMKKIDPAKIDLLITDVVMPKMNGKDLADRLLKLNPRLKILFTSGYVDDHIDSSDLLENSANFLQKPYSIQALAGRIREILDK